MTARIDDAQVALYRERGYLVVEDVLSEETLAALRRTTEETVARAGEVRENNDIYDLEESHRPEMPRVRRIKTPHKFFPFFRALAADPAITGILARLIGPNIRLHGSKLNMKAAGYGAPVEWHQDWAFYPHTNDDVLAVGVMLDDVALENGPLLVVPGTHKGPVLDHHSDGWFCGAIDPGDPELDVSGAVPLTGRAGSITIHHARLVHGSALNRSNRQRRLLLFEYAAADAWPLMGMRDTFEAFNGRMVLGEPTLQPRVVPAPIRMPLPESPHPGSIYENQRGAGRRFFETFNEERRASAT